MKNNIFDGVRAIFYGLSMETKTEPAGRIVVLRGGTLIDATGRPPLHDSVVIIDRDRIKSIGRNIDEPIPKGSRIIDAKGKTILPGFLDGHCHLEDFVGEIYLHLGITGCADIEIFRDDYWSMAQRDGTNMGKIRGPRIWSAGRALGPRPYAWGLEGGRGFRGNIEFKTPEEGRTIVRKKKDIGIDIIKLNEFLTPELVRAIIEEAHHLGLPVTGHSLDVVSYARAGVDGIEHQWSVGYSSISNLNKRKRLVEQKLLGHIGQEELPFFYDTNNFDKIIDAMVENGVSWSPTIATWWRPLSPSASAFRKRELSILNNPDAKYLPPALRAITLGQYEKFKRWPPEKLNRVKKGFEKIQKFMRRFVKAGGIIKAGSDPNAGIPALLVHQELKMYVEAGLTPMQAIQAATINVAKTFKKDMDFGTVEPGKVADLIVVDGNPLKDIWATQNVKMVIMNGQVIDIKFHANHENPIPSPDPWRAIPREIEIFPSAIAERSGPALLRVKPKTGGFDSFHKVTFNGTELETRFVNKNELQAVIPPRVIKKAGVYPIAVVNPGDFGGRSYSTHLIVTFVSEKAGKPNSLLVKVGKNARS